MNLREILSTRVRAAMDAVEIPPDCAPAVTPGTRPDFGDYQANGAMAAAKRLRTNPRELAARIVSAIELGDMADKVDIAGPGFINIRLSPAWLAAQLETRTADSSLGVRREQSQTIVVDYSAPNLAKEMHVGHLRSTIIGDAVVRALELRGDTVIRQNHVGDWGTQFGMLIAQLEDQISAGIDLKQVALADIEEFYRSAKKRFDEDDQFADRSRDYVVRLQSGDTHCRTLWQEFINISFSHCEEIYQLLNVTLTPSDMMPESAYNNDLAGIMSTLEERGLLSESDGARVVFLDEIRDREDQPMAVIVQKRDGGFLYSTTDLAATRHRSQLGAERILYFIDDRQRLHLQQIFAISRMAGLVDDKISLEHHPFGKMLGADGRPFKTRAGGTIKLIDLIHEAVNRAATTLAQRDAELDTAERAEIAHKVGIGAVKYADLSKHRTSDYIFNWEQMLSFEGNTAPYLQYAYTRIRSLFRRAGVDPESQFDRSLKPDVEEERRLALKLLQFPEAIDSVTGDALPHLLCVYLYELAGLFMRFYERCPVLHDDVDEATRLSRLALCQHTGQTLRVGLDVLGIEVMERM